METSNLVLEFKLSGDCRLHVKQAARIKVDGCGALMLYDARGGAVERIDLQQLQSFSILPVFAAGHFGTAMAAS